jgi:hypothetical protein
MKKSKVYFIAPLIALAVFYAYYWNFSSQYEAKQAAVVKAEKEKRLEKLRAEAERNEKAIHDAIEEQKIRKQQRIEREEKDIKQKNDRENARLGVEKADQESQKLSRQAEKLQKDVVTAKEEIAKIEAENKRSVEEEAFLKTYVIAAVENRSKLSEVLAKIDAADKAAAKAALEAAAAKK